LTIVPTKQCRKVISHTIWLEEKDTTTTTTLTQDLSIQQNNINKIVEENQDIPTAPTGVPPHCPAKPSYNKSLHVLHVASSLKYSSHTQEYHVARLFKHIQPLQQQVHNNLQQAKKENFFSKESNSPRFRFNKIFPRDLT
jgi:hypothetical protein